MGLLLGRVGMSGDHNPFGSIERRSVLQKLGGGLAVALGGLSPVTQTAAAHEKSTVGKGIICDISGDQVFSAQMPLAADPAGERGTVVHATSRGQRTRDYVCSTVDLTDFDFTLGGVAQSGLSYEFYEGEHNTGAAPDEVFLTIKKGRDFYVAYRTLDAAPRKGTWHTRAVDDEISRSGWRTTKIDRSQINPQARLAMTSNQAITNAINLLRQEPSTDLLDKFGRNAQLLAVTLGVGSVTRPQKIDTYFDSLQIAGDRFAIPGVVVLDSVFDNVQNAVEAFHVHLGFQVSVPGVSLDAVDLASVRLAQYSEIGPPVPGTSAERRALESEDGRTGLINRFGLRVDFNRNQLRGQVDVDDPVVVYGDFAYPDAVDHPLSFVASGRLTENH